MAGMNLLSRLRRRSRAQTATEYMLMISVISLGLWVALEKFSNPSGPVQQGAETLTSDLQQSLSNTGSMGVQ
jgi:hypothetical protein